MTRRAIARRGADAFYACKDNRLPVPLMVNCQRLLLPRSSLCRDAGGRRSISAPFCPQCVIKADSDLTDAGERRFRRAVFRPDIGAAMPAQKSVEPPAAHQGNPCKLHCDESRIAERRPAWMAMRSGSCPYKLDESQTISARRRGNCRMPLLHFRTDLI